jgi:hypothetical protein
MGGGEEIQAELLARIRAKVDRDPTDSPALFTECAWCGKVRTGEGWAVDADIDPPAVHTSHGICPDCVTMLRSNGKSL